MLKEKTSRVFYRVEFVLYLHDIDILQRIRTIGELDHVSQEDIILNVFFAQSIEP